MKIIQSSFFWQSDKPAGLAFSFAFPDFSSEMLTEAFDGQVLKDYLRHSDEAMGTGTVAFYLEQLAAIADMKHQGHEIPLPMALMAAYNIIWLTERGFMPNDEFNGPQYVKEL